MPTVPRLMGYICMNTFTDGPMTGVTEVLKVAPPAIVSTITLFNISIDVWIKVATLIYVLILLSMKIKDIIVYITKKINDGKRKPMVTDGNS